MPVQIVRPHSIGVASGGVRRAVLLTGASGVVGRAVLRRLRDFDVVCSVHRSPVCGPNVTAVPGDVARPMFGLAEQAYVELVGRVDVVIHCAAVTDFNCIDGSPEATNVAGKNRVSEGEFWISAGDKALRLDESAAVTVELVRRLGVDIDMPRFVPPDMSDRLIVPVFLGALPDKIRRNVLRMLEFFTTHLQSGQAKPSSLHQLVTLGARPLPDQRESPRSTQLNWAAQAGYGQAEIQWAA